MSCMKTCYALKVCSKTPIFDTKTNNHDAPCTRTYKYFKIYTEKYKLEGNFCNPLIQIENLFESIYIKRPAVRKHEARHRRLRKTNLLYDNV